MSVIKVGFPDKVAILPSDTYRFGSEKSDKDKFEIIYENQTSNGIRVIFINSGLVAFDFTKNLSLGCLSSLKFTGQGNVPQSVMESNKQLIDAQDARMKLSVFLCACVFGTHAAKTHSSVSGALFPGLDEVYFFDISASGQFGIISHETDKLWQRFLRRPNRKDFIQKNHIEQGFKMALSLIDNAKTYAVANPMSMIVMNYQAMILHNRQHAGASIALQALISEVAMRETLYAAGLVDGVAPRLPSLAKTPGPLLSKSAAKKLGFGGTIEALSSAGVISAYLKQRTHALREARNSLMHNAEDCSPAQSGEGLTVVRDLLNICNGIDEFELNMPWSYRM